MVTTINEIKYVDWQPKLNDIGEVVQGIDDINQCINIILTTQKDKFYAIPDIGEHVACLMDENSEEGVILGAIYSALDETPASSKNQLMIKFEDESFIQFDKETGILTLKFSGIDILSDINHTGKLQNSDGITSSADITDKTSSMQAMRDKYNPHTHIGNMGSPTSAPSEEMS